MPDRVSKADAQVPLAVSVFSAPITHPAWRTSQIIPPDVERMYAKRRKEAAKGAGSN
jgi:hypothetical protein